MKSAGVACSGYRAWELSPGGWEPHVYVGVLFALGGGMILGSLLLWLRPRHLIALSVGLTVCVEWLTPHPSKWQRPAGLLPRLLWLPGGDSRMWVNYPVLPGLTFPWSSSAACRSSSTSRTCSCTPPWVTC